MILLQFDDFQCLLQIKREKEDKKGRCQPIKKGERERGKGRKEKRRSGGRGKTKKVKQEEEYKEKQNGQGRKNGE